MPEGFEVPHWSYEDIRRSADAFLARFHPTRSIPVPIEDIVDGILRVNIVAMPGLLSVFDIDAFTSSDLSTIEVDEFIYMSRPNRYRFSLAHEAGHIWMHRDLYTNTAFDKIDQFRDFVDSIPEQDYSRLEWQAYCFAGLALVPTEHLQPLVDSETAMIHSAGISIEENADFAWDCIAACVAKAFGVSGEVIHRRMGYEGIRDRRN